MDIVNYGVFDARLLDTVARAALGRATCGVSCGADSRIHLLAHNSPERQRASDVLNNFDTLRLTAAPASPRQGGEDPVVSCRDAAIAADAKLGYVLLLGGEERLRGQADLSGGVFSLTLPGLVAGDYRVFIYRLSGDYASGTLRLRVDPA